MYRKTPDTAPCSIRDLKNQDYKDWLIEVLTFAPKEEAADLILDSLIAPIADFTKRKQFERLGTNFSSQEFFSNAIDTVWRGCTRLTIGLVPTFDNWMIVRLNGTVQDCQRKHDILSRNDRLHYKKYKEQLEEISADGTFVDCHELMSSVLPERLPAKERKAKAQSILNRVKAPIAISHTTIDIVDPTLTPEQSATDQEFIASVLKKAKKMGLTNRETQILTEILHGSNISLSDETREKIVPHLPSLNLPVLASSN